MEYAEIEYGVADRIATITLNRPEARNGYTMRMADEIAAALGAANTDPEAASVHRASSSDLRAFIVRLPLRRPAGR